MLSSSIAEARLGLWVVTMIWIPCLGLLLQGPHYPQLPLRVDPASGSSISSNLFPSCSSARRRSSQAINSRLFEPKPSLPEPLRFKSSFSSNCRSGCHRKPSRHSL